MTTVASLTVAAIVTPPSNTNAQSQVPSPQSQTQTQSQPQHSTESSFPPLSTDIRELAAIKHFQESAILSSSTSGCYSIDAHRLAPMPIHHPHHKHKNKNKNKNKNKSKHKFRKQFRPKPQPLTTYRDDSGYSFLNNKLNPNVSPSPNSMNPNPNQSPSPNENANANANPSTSTTTHFLQRSLLHTEDRDYGYVAYGGKHTSTLCFCCGCCACCDSRGKRRRCARNIVKSKIYAFIYALIFVLTAVLLALDVIEYIYGDAMIYDAAHTHQQPHNNNDNSHHNSPAETAFIAELSLVFLSLDVFVVLLMVTDIVLHMQMQERTNEYWHSCWNWFDLCIVVVCAMSIPVCMFWEPSLALTSVVIIARFVLRVARLLFAYHNMHKRAAFVAAANTMLVELPPTSVDSTETESSNGGSDSYNDSNSNNNSNSSHGTRRKKKKKKNKRRKSKSNSINNTFSFVALAGIASSTSTSTANANKNGGHMVMTTPVPMPMPMPATNATTMKLTSVRDVAEDTEAQEDEDEGADGVEDDSFLSNSNQDTDGRIRIRLQCQQLKHGRQKKNSSCNYNTITSIASGNMADAELSVRNYNSIDSNFIAV